MKRIGLFGGSFNPVHGGHLLVARAAKEELQLERVFFIPAAQSPFKPDTALAPAELRLRWLRRALCGWTDAEVDDREIRRGGISFTIDTVRDYHALFPGAELFYLIGADHLSLLPKWKEADELGRLAQFIVISRPGQKLAALSAPFRVHCFKGFPFAVSSSEIRARVKARLPIDLLVPPDVADDIQHNQLYL